MTEPLVDMESYGEHAMSEQDLCIAIGEDLTQHYPGYDWAVGVIWNAGSVTIRLMVDDDPAADGYGYLLHLMTALAPGAHHRVMQAGGELLERWGLPRGRAPERWRLIARENGLNVAAGIEKSRH